MKNTCPNELGVYNAMVTLKIPPHMRKENGGFYETRDKVDIDQCLVDEINHLWDNGIHTYGCCCGHGKRLGMINVDKKDCKKMIELGYEFYPNINEGEWKYTFIAKSKHVN